MALDAAQASFHSFFDVLDNALVEQTKHLGFAPDRIRLMVCMLSSLVFAQFQYTFLTRAPSAIKNLYAMSIGIFMMLWCFRLDCWVFLLTTSVTYILILALPRKLAMYIGIPFVLTALLVSHLYTMLTDWGSYVFDFTGPQMVITIKLYSLLVQLNDGANYSSDFVQKTSHIKHAAVKEIPSFLEYWGWLFFYPSVLILSCEFAHYKRFLDNPVYAEKEGRMKMFFGTFATAFLCIVIGFGIGSAFFPISYIHSDAWLTETNFWYRCFYVFCCFGTIRFQYYFAWKLTECSFILNGYSYDDINGGWSRVCNIKILDFELGQNYVAVSNAWNEAAARWLKYYVYVRVPFKGLEVFCTNIVAAIWHGFYPGFYLAFVTMGLFRNLSLKMRKVIRPHFLDDEGKPLPSKWFYDRATW
eukprot:CAMPEP_0201524574 /NCGR_PEP_ID=MMETSP0161_2-20130828/23464_1 /ASSEMBLY_ACC=CAM_ASM_000251 /TAXON_ID=180227 /ORGANISM="Neoparamoeba aestuarina, Strain SoJaBio B1-5/56/2" /LENGTH=413 /DNA_ID=CAMNT_0047924047 /DNA_START=66 /DNA_END=1304 /DNA_ORIENTATION=+